LEVVMGQQAPVIGWRLWWAQDAELRSWVADHAWRPGVNVARCLHDRHREPAPGPGCRCGLWALSDPRACVRMAALRGNQDEPIWPGRVVLGLIAGWGVVARHGTEGFRAERGRVVALFSDLVGIRRLTPTRRWHVRRRRRLAEVGERYSVPVLELGEAISAHVLQELGVEPESIGWAAELLRGPSWVHADDLVPLRLPRVGPLGRL
jgi:hypothetical protein